MSPTKLLLRTNKYSLRIVLGNDLTEVTFLINKPDGKEFYMQFFTWMKKIYVLDKTIKGTLACSMISDSMYFPKQGRHNKIIKFLVCREASDECLNKFEECWKEYQFNERKSN